MTVYKIAGSSTAVAVALTALSGLPALAQDGAFDWRAHEGETVSFLANNNPWATTVLEYADEFEELTGIELAVDSYQEQQMRQRLLTVMNARSDEIDVFMTLPSREGMQFAAAGWYHDLAEFAQSDVAPDYDYDGLSRALLDAATFDGVLTGMPLNIEGPLLYYRTDVFERCDVAPPTTLTEMRDAAATIAECEPGMTAFATRGLKPALPYTFSNVLHNMGGSYMADGKSNLCSPEAKAAIELYAGILQDYGPPGVVNYSFYQLTSLYRAGRAAMSFQSSNEFPAVMEGGDRLEDTGIMPLPAGDGGSVPTAIGWALSVSGFSDNPDAAWYFVQWATSPEMQARLALQGIAPPRSAAAENPDYLAWLEEQPVRQEWQAALGQLADTGSSEVGFPIVQNPESREYIGQAVNAVLLGQATVDEACAAADADLNALIERE
ncbi:ABC transporter substrate-binding protein [Pacificitalea manganoxidans]|uniref:ABC transporter substrate-binding protein n=1 Tax=Pacificitalea manganoxidans TaxID=1411902 RepID=A0A291LXY4_9RHOB|nr:sugar ABC transporter substrate-binding protein [Pacificitalea manganoxidans]ATI41559.1 ABC transporter substrate-binding protein [Pacificitalea manganoxidans]MDR6308984.1 multiple sugar transport system substrate-binding protein [Pacificitalea manganoxidans]